MPEIPTGKGKVYGTLNERKSPCRLRKVIESPDTKGSWLCVYDHPKSDIDDGVTVGESSMCPNMIYCDLR